MNINEMINEIARVLCGKPVDIKCADCFNSISKEKSICGNLNCCRIEERTEEQLSYILSSIKQNVFLEACPGSGKTEVVGMKSAYEIRKWCKGDNAGIAILTFTNEATDVIKSRVNQFITGTSLYPHYIGTLSSFLQGYISQPFGYKDMNYICLNDDHSFRIIDRDIDIFKNHWLQKYKCKIPYISSSGNMMDIFAHQIAYDWRKEELIIKTDRICKVVNEYYDSKNFQTYVSELRVKQNKSWLYKKDYVIDMFNDCKIKFIKDGFATYEDLNCIAYQLLDNSRIVEIIAKKFPLIIVDECQDLSWIEIQILNKLKEKGAILHFVGDINQSIFEFKKTDPEYTREYVKDFNKLKLTDNFRSCQPIVDLSNRLLNIDNKGLGKSEDKFGKSSTIYIQFKEPEEAIKKYIELLKKFKLDQNKSCVIVKQNKLKNQLLGDSTKNQTHLLISAMQLWNAATPYLKKKALEYAGKQISKWFGGAKSKDNYYCAKDINSSFAWRIFLKDVLNDCNKNTKLIKYDRKYSGWYKDAREELPNILINNYEKLKMFDDASRGLENLCTGTWYRGVDVTNLIEIVDTEVKDAQTIKISTVHGAKGCTYDSTLVISSNNSRSDQGHWKEHWINGVGEDKRIGYVASTRAKYLLAWAVPTLNNKEIKLIESFGFKNSEKL
ncbi:MAG: DNA helicase-2/ATP-dependent DNA helicase PcrA [Clostridium sp.]|jgi:DNA helicase-2/ATP-dependent DNA helicase PcrA